MKTIIFILVLLFTSSATAYPKPMCHNPVNDVFYSRADRDDAVDDYAYCLVQYVKNAENARQIIDDQIRRALIQYGDIWMIK